MKVKYDGFIGQRLGKVGPRVSINRETALSGKQEDLASKSLLTRKKSYVQNKILEGYL